MNNKKYVWLDLNSNDQVIECKDNKIFLKILLLDRLICSHKKQPSFLASIEPPLELLSKYQPNEETKNQRKPSLVDSILFSNSSSSSGDDDFILNFSEPAKLSPIDRTNVRNKERAKSESKNVKDKLLEFRIRQQNEDLRNERKKTYREEVKIEIENWKYDSMRNERNLQSLLQTLDKILWKDVKCKWNFNSIILSDSETKKLYKKAIVIVHPDKVRRSLNSSSDDPQQERSVVLAEMIFDILNTKYKSFLENCKG